MLLNPLLTLEFLSVLLGSNACWTKLRVLSLLANATHFFFDRNHRGHTGTSLDGHSSSVGDELRICAHIRTWGRYATSWCYLFRASFRSNDTLEDTSDGAFGLAFLEYTAASTTSTLLCITYLLAKLLDRKLEPSIIFGDQVRVFYGRVIVNLERHLDSLVVGRRESVLRISTIRLERLYPVADIATWR